MIEVKRVTVRAGAFELAEVSLTVPTGGYGVLMGRTGSGKTTLLEAVIGLRRVLSGRVWLCGSDVTELAPAVRGIGYVPQDGALFSTMTVAQHLSYALEIRRVRRSAIRRRVAELADLLGIRHLLHRTPHGLSGGERQRVALGRALSFQPRTLLLDEPLSALDEETRGQICALLKKVREHAGATTLHVTHNVKDAETLADHVFRLENGRVAR